MDEETDSPYVSRAHTYFHEKFHGLVTGGSAVKEIKLDDQISAVHIHSFSNGESADYIVAATWKMDLVLLEAPEWNRVANVDLNSDVFARSVLLQQLDNIDYVIAGKVIILPMSAGAIVSVFLRMSRF